MKKLLRVFFSILKYYIILVLTLGVVYLLLPPVSTLMLARWTTYRGVEYRPVSLDEISPHLIRAVIQAEDGRFCDHWGVDWRSMNKAINDAMEEDGPSKGASTLSMQVAKNLFLWPQRSYVRKALEVPIALYLDLIWSKRRMMTNYLSVAEWGDGIFGAEAAAQAYFHKSAKNLSAWEASLLAAALPNPRKRNSANPSGGQVGYAERILQNMMEAGADTSCLDLKR